jgi:aryl carrier-like protein
MNFKIILVFLVSFIFKINAQFGKKKSDFTIYSLTKSKIEKSRDSTYEIIKLIKYNIQNTILDSEKNMLQCRLDSLRDFMESFNLKDVENEFKFLKNNNTYAEAPNLLLYRLHRREGLNLFKEIKNLYKVDSTIKCESLIVV